MKKYVALVLVSAFVLSACKAKTEVVTPTEAPTEVMDTTEASPSTDVAPGEEQVMGETATDSKGGVKEFTVVGDDFSFDVTEMKVKKGDTVRITFENKEGFHDWVLDEFNAKTKQIAAGKSETIEFVADKTGTFEYYCSVGKHRQMGMKGNLIVE